MTVCLSFVPLVQPEETGDGDREREREREQAPQMNVDGARRGVRVEAEGGREVWPSCFFSFSVWGAFSANANDNDDGRMDG